MINKIIEELFIKNGIEDIKVSKSNRPDLCDYQSNDIFKIAKKEGKSPIEVGKEVELKINDIKNFNDYFESVQFVAPGFLNIKINNNFICNVLRKMSNDNKFNIQLPEKSETFVVDYCGANVAKPLHVGHMRTTIVGESIARIIRFMGHKTICDVHLGDYGLQIGEVIYAILEDKIPLEDIDINYLDVAYPKMSARCKEDEKLKEECARITKELQDGNEEYRKLWKKILDVSVEDIKKNCDYLGAKFDYWYGESDAYPYIPKIEKILNEKGLLRQSEGALVVDVEEPTDKKEIPPLLFKKSNGAYLYASTDLACLLQRKEDFNPDHVLYVTDLRQALHFEQVFRTIEKCGIFKRTQLEHLGYGTVNGLDGKPFKTREGTAPKLESLYNDIKEIFISKKEENKNLSNEDLDKIVNSILKYGDLQNSKEKDYIFNIEKFSDTIGKTGPYILYTYLRVNKILKDNCYIQKDLSSKIYNESDRNLRMKLFDVEDYIYLAYNNRNPFYLADYVYDLCLLVNNFYQNNNISNLTDEENKNDWLYVLNLSNRIIKEVLDLLVIQIPSKM
ncbi:MAG: arginine--tRNA ligase [Bacilli bacterium]|nr:arginine--tRNA ligase [Bacilli bacterium]